MTENIIVMLVAAEVMAPASAWKIALSPCPPAIADTRQEEEMKRTWRRHTGEEEEEEERRNPTEQPQFKSNGTLKCPLTSTVK